MKLPDEALLLLVRQWIAKAEVNYRTAERLVRDDEPIRESIAFHCQQTAEKYLKAFLVS
jgi:HEPN domain-containing protein